MGLIALSLASNVSIFQLPLIVPCEGKFLNHTRGKFKYRIVFIPKCRKKILFGQIRMEMEEVFH